MNNIDVLLVRYCPQNINAELWDYTVSVISQCPVNLLTYDNTEHNIGLAKARIALTKKATSPYIVFMDFDFKDIKIDFPRLIAGLNHPKTGMTVAYSRQASAAKPYLDGPTPIPGQEFQEIRHLPCNVMAMKRSLYDEVGGFFEQYHTAYADTDLVNRLRSRGLKVMQHNRSRVIHLGRSNAIPGKREIWNADRMVYESRQKISRCR